MISLIVFFFVLSVLIVVHEFGHFIAAKKSGVKVERFALGFGPKLIAHKRKGTEYAICAIPLGGYVKMAGDNLDEYKGNPDEYFSKNPGVRFNIIFFGPLLNYILGFLCFCLIFFAGYPNLTTKVGGLVDEMGAGKAGIKENDVITAIDSKKVYYWDDLQKTVQEKKNAKSVKVYFTRDGQAQSVDVSIQSKSFDDGLGQKRTVGLIGIIPADEVVKVKHGLFESFYLGLKKTGEFTLMTYKALWRMVTGRLSMRESVTGPLGMFYITSKAASLGWIAVVHVIAVLSLSLGIFNLLPMPVLDGGHIFLLAVEKIRGKSISKKLDKVFTHIGLSLIITMAVFVFFNDLVRFGIFDKVAGWIK